MTRPIKKARKLQDTHAHARTYKGAAPPAAIGAAPWFGYWSGENAAPAIAPVTADGNGMRANDGKNRIELLPAIWTWSLGLVMTRGAIKYEVRNWERGMPWSRMLGSCSRHIFRFVCGERYDKETGVHHLAHAAWNCLALMTYDIRAIGTNDMGSDTIAHLEAVAVEPGPELLEIMKAKGLAQ